MTSVGWVGLGRLGAPCAAALAHHGGHIVHGYDVRGVDPATYDWSGLPPIELAPSIDDVVAKTDDVVFVSVQTPHARRYGGETIAPSERRDFEYGYLVQAVGDVAAAARRQAKEVTLVVVSTVLPGTFDRRLRTLLNEYVTPVYHPFFIAMGTVVNDFIRPEMTLFGVDRLGDESPVLELYASLHDAPYPTTSIASAELTKVAYNTFISSKIVFANTLAQLAEYSGADVDEVTGALEYGTQRLWSTSYARAGVGDGGACHPRDNVALSYLAEQSGAVDLMGFLTRAREEHARWLVKLTLDWVELTQLPLALLGKTYKPDVALVDGSPALLMANLLALTDRRFTHVDPLTTTGYYGVVERLEQRPHVCLLATRHHQFSELNYAAGSVVIDPFGFIPRSEGVVLVTPGRRRS